LTLKVAYSLGNPAFSLGQMTFHGRQARHVFEMALGKARSRPTDSG